MAIPALTADECAAAKAGLTALRAARLQIIAGGGIASVTHANKEVRYFAGNLAQLDAEIRRLQLRADACNGVTGRFGFIHNTPSDC